MEKKRAQQVLKVLSKEFRPFSTELRHEKPWHLLVAVVLSAQTTDANVNKATPGLFRKYKTVKTLADAPLPEIEQLVYSTGYYKSKAKRIKELCKELHNKHNGHVPDSMEKLVELPGVGRKTANVVLHILHDTQEGIVFDTHVARITHRLGFTEKKDPKKGEEVMMELLPKKQWKLWGDFLIQHGRKTCHARKPNCGECKLNKICPSAT